MLLKNILNNASTGFLKFFTRDKIIIFIALFVLSYALFLYGGSKNSILDNMEDGSNPKNIPSMNGEPTVKNTNAQNVVPPMNNYNTKSVASPDDLLPNDQNSEWASLNPVGLNNANVMPVHFDAGYHIGLDTIGQTLRNANLQERSDPIIPKKDVGPWNVSTIEPDLGRVPLELGYGCKN